MLKDMFNKLFSKPKVSDMSFSNVFTKKIVVRLIVMVMASITLLSIAQSATELIFKQKIENEVLKASAELTYLVSLDASKNKTESYANYILSTTQNELASSPFLSNVAFALYNDTRGELISRSSRIPVLLSESTLTWWRNKSGDKIGYPTIYVNSDLTQFMIDHQDRRVVAEQIYYSNFILYPVQLAAFDENNKRVAEITDITPSNQTGSYDGLSEIELKGNSVDEKIYSKFVQFIYRSAENATSSQNEIEIQYENIDILNQANLTTYKFSLGENTYRLDYTYQISFWDGAWQNVIFAELFGILLCVGFAFINTKETFTIYS